MKNAPRHIIRETEGKTTARYHHTPISLATLTGEPNSGTLTTPNAHEDTEQQELSFAAAGNAKRCGHCKTTVWWFLTKLNII